MTESEDRPNGIAVVDKAAGMTSHDVVDRARKVLGERKVGHSGTLDPDATGILLLGIGPSTRLLRFLTDLPKTYTASFILGTETSTLDAAGAVTAIHDMAVTPQQVADAATAFVGEIDQVPPMVSAVRVDGRRLHELAREGKEVEREPRRVTVHRYVVEPTDDPLVYRAEVECSSGTYIRTLAADLGTALGGGAHLTDLRRTRIGSFGEAEARPVEDVALLSPKEGLRDYAQTTVDDDLAFQVGNGRVLDPDQLGGVTGPGPWAVSDRTGRLLAVYERVSQHRVKPSLVLGH
ncbi:MAG TPA: tRNA pseudouridine(55) synthase TruB [Acidimicrobiales bacterium]